MTRNDQLFFCVLPSQNGQSLVLLHLDGLVGAVSEPEPHHRVSPPPPSPTPPRAMRKHCTPKGPLQRLNESNGTKAISQISGRSLKNVH